MAELIIKVDVPDKLESEFKSALKRVVDKFMQEVDFSLANKILSKSKLTEKQAKELADEVKEAVAKRHGVI